MDFCVIPLHKEKNFDYISKLLDEELCSTSELINFVNSLGKQKFCSLMFTNFIFHVLYDIDELDHDKILYTCKKAVKQGYQYIITTICQNSEAFCKILFPGTCKSNRVPNFVKYSDYTLSCYGNMHYNIYVGRTYMNSVLETEDFEDIKALKYKYMGRMVLGDVNGYVEDDPSHVIDTIDISLAYRLGLMYIDDDDYEDLKPKMYDLFCIKKSDDISVEKLYNNYKKIIESEIKE